MEQRAFESDTEGRAFRDSLEQDLRKGEPDVALRRVHEMLPRLVGADQRLIELARSTKHENIQLTGWGTLGERIKAYEERGEIINAVGIDFSWPGHVGLEPDSHGHLAPYIETNYYSDMKELAFSCADREALLKGYGSYGSEWQGMFNEIDNLISVQGMEGLYGAVQIASKHNSDESVDGDAYMLAACASAILLHQAVRRTILQNGLPKPLTVIVGSNEDYPFFDAPVWTVYDSVPAKSEHANPPNPGSNDARDSVPRSARKTSRTGDAKGAGSTGAGSANSGSDQHEREALNNAAHALQDDLKDVGNAVSKLLRNKDALRVIGAAGVSMAIKALRNGR